MDWRKHAKVKAIRIPIKIDIIDGEVVEREFIYTDLISFFKPSAKEEHRQQKIPKKEVRKLIDANSLYEVHNRIQRIKGICLLEKLPSDVIDIIISYEPVPIIYRRFQNYTFMIDKDELWKMFNRVSDGSAVLRFS